ncbi:ABC transporter substrate-binding protein [Streptomyces aidingensis]|uniref:Alpha-glucoside transport system substrate-binding protein n=1 Tax=Streptomyces aidingensis TaxID=910347 RepID=A0A1I1DXQ8_9ACTN|nr:extracellular solute-binding protein [Streptomyces aidingensis]SFB79681.1 alpha-glucoside transport system substrate-binding protein [Streptomyces aidingensis]
MRSSIRSARYAARAVAAITAVSALTLTACSGDDDASGTGGGGGGDAPSVELPDLSGQKLEVAAVWTGAEQDNFMAAVEEFEDRTGAEVTFVPTGDNVATFVGQKIAGGSPPDVVLLPQVGVLHEFADKGWLAPVGALAEEQLDANYGDGWRNLGAHDEQQYGVYIKAANKSLIWYSTGPLETAGVSVPETWDDFITAASTVSDSGTPPVSVGGADGWTLTDWFENIYLSQAGPQMYDRLAAHEVPWTDQSVTDALTTLGELFGRPALLAGGTDGALRTDFPNSVTKVFADLESPEAAMVYEGDFVGTVISDSTDAVIGEDAQVFPFPAVGDEAPVVSGGDVAVAISESGEASEAQQALLGFFASTDAAALWAERGGFISPNRSLDPEVYPDEVQRTMAEALIAAGDDFRFDLSDQTPAAFGGTTGQGMWQGLQDFLRNPADVQGVQEYLETQAAAAYGE